MDYYCLLLLVFNIGVVNKMRALGAFISTALIVVAGTMIGVSGGIAVGFLVLIILLMLNARSTR